MTKKNEDAVELIWGQSEEFVARAINCHHDLLASLRELLPYATKAVKDLNEQMVGSLYPRINAAMLERAKAAIAKATEPS